VAILTNACSGNINNVNVKVRMFRGPFLLTSRCTAWRTFWPRNAIGSGEPRSSSTAWSWRHLSKSSNWACASRTQRISRVLAGCWLPHQHHRTAPFRWCTRKETLDLASYPKTVKTPVQAFRIGPVGIVTFPGEAFVELGLELKRASSMKPVFPIELANDYRGYIPTREAFGMGGYETWRAKSSCLEEQAASRLTSAALRRLEAVRKGA